MAAAIGSKNHETHTPMKTKRIVPILLLSLYAQSLYAFVYGEHLIMGNTALLRFYTMQIDRSDRVREMSPFRFDTSSKSYIFPTLSIFDQPVGYGTINALSGDHSWNPLQLEKDLVTTNSDMLRVMALHQQHMMQFDLAAPDGKLARVDNNYILLAAKNFSHFYDYGRSLEYHLSPLDTAMIGQLTIPALVPGTFRELNATNAINMYVAVHSAAILLAEQAGAHPDIEKAKKLLYYAFLYNAYADHFLQDAFSAGHLLVNRSLFASITNNKALHDFYSNYGTSVVNARGNIWTAYGDKHFNQQHLQYEKKWGADRYSLSGFQSGSRKNYPGHCLLDL
jgi:hypothetical protein